MQYLKTYLKKITDRGNTKLAESIEKTANDVGNKHIKTFSFSSHEIGLLLGNVQSGKTGQMFGIICKAADLGFPFKWKAGLCVLFGKTENAYEGSSCQASACVSTNSFVRRKSI